MTEASEPTLRAVLAAAAPRLATLPLALVRAPDTANPLFASAGVRIGGRAYAKFAFSELTAIRLMREAQALRLLGEEVGLPVPALIAAARDPAFLATAWVNGGAPLGFRAVAASDPGRRAALADELAGFLAQLHAPDTLALALAREGIERLPRVPEAGLHIPTDELRTRLAPIVEPRRRATIGRWCDWIDEQLASPAPAVLVHGDFHPYNQLWDLDAPRLIAVTDLESCGLAPAEFDFRVLPVFGPGVELLLAVVDRYEALSARRLALPRIMAHHLLNYLGDAVWRTEAGIALPEPGTTPSDYVEEAAGRLAALGIRP